MGYSTHSRLDSVRAYGSHEHIWVYDDPKAIETAETTEDETSVELNTDLTFTFDSKHIVNVQDFVRMAQAYEGVDIAVADDTSAASFGRKISYLTFENQDLRTVRDYYASASEPILNVIAVLSATSSNKRAALELLEIIDRKAQANGVSMDAIQLVEGHIALGRNYLVSDNPDVHKLRHIYFTDRSRHLIYSSQLGETIERLERRRRVYYLGPGYIITPRGYYYWELLQKALPNYDQMWASAIYGVHEGGLDQALFDFAQSLSDRAMGLLQLRDDLELLAEDAPNTKSEWEMVNLLNYFVVLVTGLFDNVAWLASIRHGLLPKYTTKVTQVILRVKRDPTGVWKPKEFQQELQQVNSQLYNHILNHQNLLEVFYPVRDSVQHRVVLSGSVLVHLDEKWNWVVVRFEDESVKALLTLAPPIFMSMNSWDVFELPNHRCLIEPSLFAKRAVDEVLRFVNTAIGIIDIPALLANNPPLLAKANQPRKT